MDIIKKYLPYMVFLIIGLVLGFWIGGKMADPIIQYVEKPVQVQAETKTETQIVYVEKDPGEKTDLEANVGKQELNVRVNGNDIVIPKKEEERFMFDKNKIFLDQTSKASLDINIPTIDKTKRWGIGAGFGNNGVGYMIKFPAGKLDGWGYKDQDTTAAGIMIGF